MSIALPFKTLLEEMDCREQAPHSVLNHHAEGLDYICLHRGPNLTVKLYLIEKPRNINSGFLVNPHSHRYGFFSSVLKGALQHVRFQRVKGRGWDEFAYNPDIKSVVQTGRTGLEHKSTLQGPGSSYYVDPNEIHTLQMIPNAGPTLIALQQFRDVRAASELYLPTGSGGKRMVTNGSRAPKPRELEALRDRCLDLLG